MRMTAALMLLPLLGSACVDPTRYDELPEITNHVEDWRDEIIYQVLIDRFANGDRNNDFNVTQNDDVLARHLGGDFQGVIDNVDYLVALGITAVWVSPIVVNVEEDAGIAGYHGYWAQNFKAVNPHFGDMTTFRRMVDVLHDHDIKVILDIVTNHVGQLFYYDINRNGQPDATIFGAGSLNPDEFMDDPIHVISEWDPPYDPRGIQGWTSLGESGPAPIGWVYMPEINRVPPQPPEFHNEEWYNRRGRVTNWNDAEQVEKGDFPGGLKDLDTTHPDVVAALIDVYQFWIEQTNIDGFRIDTVKHVETSFWQQFNPAIRQHAESIGKRNFLQFGEVFDGNDARIGMYTYDGMMDSLFYFSHKFQVFDDVFQRGGPTQGIQNLYQQRYVHYSQVPHAGGIGVPPTQAMVNFIDNHDVPRFLYDHPDEDALKAALFYLLTMDGIPCIYYGTEQGFDGGNDPANREPLWWTGMATDGELFQHVATLNRLRRTYAPLRRGGFDVRWVSDRTGTAEDAHLVAFERPYDGESVLVVQNTWNAGTAHTSFGGNDMPVSFAPGTVLEVVFPVDDGRTFTVSGNSTVRVPVGPHEGLVLVPTSQVQQIIH